MLGIHHCYCNMAEGLAKYQMLLTLPLLVDIFNSSVFRSFLIITLSAKSKLQFHYTTCIHTHWCHGVPDDCSSLHSENGLKSTLPATRLIYVCPIMSYFTSIDPINQDQQLCYHIRFEITCVSVFRSCDSNWPMVYNVSPALLLRTTSPWVWDWPCPSCGCSSAHNAYCWHCLQHHCHIWCVCGGGGVNEGW